MKPLLRLALASSAILAPASVAAAQSVTPTHSSETPMIFEPFESQVVFATLVGPPAGESVWKTELHLDWTAGPVQSAAAFGLHLSTNALAGGPSGTLTLTGADLGWSGSGTFSAVVETHLFDDTLLSGLPGFPSTFDLTLEAAGGGGLFGKLEPTSKIVFYLGPRADVDVPSVSLSAGGTQTLSLNAGPTVGPGELYLVAGSVTGTQPFVLNGISVPLQLDAYTTFTATSANQTLFTNTLGFLDGQGMATAQVTLPAGTSPSLAGATLHHAMLGLDLGSGALTFASNAVDLLLVP